MSGFTPIVRAAHVYSGAVALILLIGVLFRSQRFWVEPIALWGDEAAWALRLFEDPLTDLLFRPVGFMALTKLVTSVHVDERTLRLLPYLAGLASLPLALYVATRLFQSKALRLLCLFMVAFHPVLIDMSREFKPYSVEFLAHLSLLALYLRYERVRQRQQSPVIWAALLLGAGVIGFLFAYNIVVALPSVYLLFSWPHLRGRRFRPLVAFAGSAAVTLALIAVVYATCISKLDHESERQSWGGKYDVFYVEDSSGSGRAAGQFGWMLTKYAELAAFPGVQRDHWNPVGLLGKTSQGLLKDFDRFGWILLHIWGLAALARTRQYERLVLLSGPVAVTAVLNLLGYWPFGAFRANTFLLAYLVFIPLCGIDAWLASARRVQWVGLGAVATLVLLPNLTAGFSWHERKYAYTFHAEILPLFERLIALDREAPPSKGKRQVLMDAHSCQPFAFYRDHHEFGSRQFGDTLRERFEVRCLQSLRKLTRAVERARRKPAFLVVTHAGARRRIASGHPARDAIFHEMIRESHDLYLLGETRRAPLPPQG